MNSYRQYVETEIRRQIECGYYSCGCCGIVGGGICAVGNRRPLESEPVPVDADSVFEIASLSKTFTALICAILRHDGKIDIDAPFTEYLPDHILAKSGTKITIRDIASHCAGFTDGWMGKCGIYGGHEWPFKNDDAFEAATFAVLPDYARGEKVVYACHNMILIGFILERLTGCNLDTLARKYIWNPLGMSSTSWNNQPDNPHTVQMYTHGPIKLGFKGDEKAHGCTRPVGNAGIFTSLRDMMKYADDMLNRRTFPQDCYELLFTPYVSIDGTVRSFGWDMSPTTTPKGWSEKTINHSGYTGQYVAVDPVNHRAGVVLTNLRLDEPSARAKAYADRRNLLSLSNSKGTQS